VRPPIDFGWHLEKYPQPWNSVHDPARWMNRVRPRQGLNSPRIPRTRGSGAEHQPEGCVSCVRAEFSQIRTQAGGAIVNTASIAIPLGASVP
jgi:hypothetical protein